MPRLLDLFCGAGGAAVGYHRAGFDEIVGVDIKSMSRYPFEFVQADALEYVAEHGHEFDAIHASPPCQGYSIMNNLPWLEGREYPLLILPMYEILEGIDKPYVIENVMGARYGASGLKKRGIEGHGLKAGWLCGGMFGLPFYRHRLFASNWFWLAPGHPKHTVSVNPRSERWIYGGTKKGLASREGAGLTITRGSAVTEQIVVGSLSKWQNGIVAGIGHTRGWHRAAEAMGIDWMKREELTQAIPPSYTEFIGKELLKVLKF